VTFEVSTELMLIFLVLWIVTLSRKDSDV